MNPKNDKEGSGNVKSAVIGGIFVVAAACITGVFLILNTMVENGVIVFGMSNPSVQSTATVFESQAIALTDTPQVIITSNVPATNAPVNETLANCSSLSSGETRTVPPGTYILGDVVIDGTPQYVTSIPNEGTVAYFEREATVLAQWGAACFTGSSSLKDEVIQGELQHGCGSKCTSVRFVLVQNDGQHVEIFP